MPENRIKELREAQNMTLVNLRDAVNAVLKEKKILVKGKILQVTDSQLSFYENGKRSPRSKEIWEVLAEIFDVDKLYLMGLSDKKTLENSLTLFEYIEIGLKALEKELKQEHTEEERQQLIQLKKILISLKNKVSKIDVNIEKFSFCCKADADADPQKILSFLLKKDTHKKVEKEIPLAIKNMESLYEKLSDENFLLWLNLGYTILKSQNIDD
uniref:helix-turn-helix domain-containing protein n=1 Tax=Lactococcus garvieae TaxID=1363 RepID=UPI00359C4E65